MTKTGRNEPCTCGSGKKYKKCCLGKEQECTVEKTCMLIDSGTLWNMRFISEKILDYEKIINPTKEITFRKTLLKHNVKSLREIFEEEKFLLEYLDVVEGEMKNVIENYSLYELYFWTHRIPPKNAFGVSDLTITLYRELLSEAIQKYAKTEGIFSQYSENIVVPEYVKDTKPWEGEFNERIKKILIDCYKLEYLSFLFIRGTQLYRILNKGGHLKEDQEIGFTCVASEKIGKLIEFYDERLKYVNLLSNVGTFIETDIERSVKNQNVGLIFVYNYDTKNRVPLITSTGTVKEEVNSNYCPGLINLDDLYGYVKVYKEEFFAEYGFSVDNFFEFFHAFFTHLIIIFLIALIVNLL